VLTYDANESNWTFAIVEDVGIVNKPQVKRLAPLAVCRALPELLRTHCGRHVALHTRRESGR